MRTNIILDDSLVEEALKLTGIKTKSQLVHQALLLLVKSKKRRRLSELEGKVEFSRHYDYKKLRTRAEE